MERKAYMAFGETGFGEMGFGETGRHQEIAYLSLVRSVVEYSATVWDPHLCKDRNAVEMVQSTAARKMKNDHRQTSSVTQMLKDLGW